MMGMFREDALPIVSDKLEAKIDLILDALAEVVSEFSDAGYRVCLEYDRVHSLVRLNVTDSCKRDRLFITGGRHFVAPVKK